MTDYFADDKPRTWSLADIYDDLGGLGDIHRTLNVNRHRVNGWLMRRERIKCPMPIKRISGTDIYSMQEWRDWYAQWLAKHKPDTKWTDNATVDGNGKPFFTYFDD